MDISRALNPVDNPKELERGDYVVALTRDSVYMDRVSGVTYCPDNMRVELSDGVLEPDHSRIDVSEDLPNQSPFNLNEAMEVYVVPGDFAPEKAYEEDSLIGAIDRLY